MADRDELTPSDMEPEGSGVEEGPLRREYEQIALRDDLARRFEDLVVSVQAWASQEGSSAAQALANDLQDIYERLGESIEETDDDLGPRPSQGYDPGS